MNRFVALGQKINLHESSTPNRLAADFPKAPMSFGCTFAMSLSISSEFLLGRPPVAKLASG